MRNTTIVVSFVSVCIITSFAQPTIQWQKCLGGSGEDGACSIQQTSDGGYIVAGYFTSYEDEVGYEWDWDYWVVKLDPSGNIQWETLLRESGSDQAYSIQQTRDGGYIVAGYSSSDFGDVPRTHGSTDYWVVKLDPSGNIIWQKSLGGGNTDFAYSVQQTSDGGYIVAGSSYSNNGDVSGNHGDSDYWVVKLDSLGNIVWQKSLGGSGGDRAYSIQQTSDGGYIVAGYSVSNDGDVTGNHGGADYWVVKLDPSGNIEWQKSLGGSSGDEARSIQQTSDGGYIVAGYSSSNDWDVTENHGGYDYWVVKLDPSGNIEWQKSLGGSSEDRAYSIHQTSDGGYIVAGYSVSNDGDVTGNHGAADYWVLKLNSSGNIVWQKSLGGRYNDKAFSTQQTSDGGYIVAGYTGCNDGDVSGNHGYYDYWIVKLSPDPTYIESQQAILPDELYLNAYPNPFNSAIIIEIGYTPEMCKGLIYQTPTDNHPCKGLIYQTPLIQIFNLNGNCIWENKAGSINRTPTDTPPREGLINQAATSADPRKGLIYQTPTFIWQPTKDTPAGIYLVRASIENKSVTKKIIYLK